MLEFCVCDHKVVSFSELYKTIAVFTSITKAEPTYNVTSCDVTRSSASIPIAGYNKKVTVWQIIYNILELIVKVIFRLFIRVECWGVN
jgi:hypothetical protein